jgi:fermentation-respiration switch protein FrsA (DUF1100 family)
MDLRKRSLMSAAIMLSKAQQPKELLIIPDASHFDLYDKPQYVTPAVNRMAKFFGKHL